MKKLFLLFGFLALTAACNMGTPAPEIESTPTATLLPTSIPATTTPTLVPAPADTPVPAPPPLYFTDEFDTASTFWEFSQTGGTDSPLTTYENGTLHINLPSPDTWYLGVHNANIYTDVVVRAKISAGTTGSMGVICLYDESTGWFEFNVDNMGTYSLLLGQWLAPGIAKYIPIVTNGSSQLYVANVNYEIGLSCQGNLLSLYVNDSLLQRLDVTNYGLTEGKIGIAAASYKDAPMTAIFEWVKVSSEE